MTLYIWTLYKYLCASPLINSSPTITMSARQRRQPTQFKKGHSPWNRGLTSKCEDSTGSSEQDKPRTVSRMDAEEFSLVTSSTAGGTVLTTPDCDGKSSSVLLLRPRTPSKQSPKEQSHNESLEGMRLYDSGKMIDGVNAASSEHRLTSPSCDELHLKMANEIKWGTCWKVTFKCTNCEFVSSQMKFYKEVAKPTRAKCCST